MIVFRLLYRALSLGKPGRKGARLSPALSQARGMWLPAWIVMACALLTSACVPFIMNGKGKADSDKAAEDRTSLQKPRIPDDAPAGPGAVESKTGADASPAEKAPRPEKTEHASSNVPVKIGSGSNELKADAPRPPAGARENPTQPPASPKADAAPTWGPAAGSGPPPQNQAAGWDTSVSLDDDEEPGGEAAGKTGKSRERERKKHDHAKYRESIEKKASDRLAEDRNATHGRLCRDVTTHEWSLSIYQKSPQNFSFVTLVYDEVDEKWKEAFSSGRRALTQWKQHLDFSGAGKDCTVLKGSFP